MKRSHSIFYYAASNRLVRQDRGAMDVDTPWRRKRPSEVSRCTRLVKNANLSESPSDKRGQESGNCLLALVGALSLYKIRFSMLASSRCQHVQRSPPGRRDPCPQLPSACHNSFITRPSLLREPAPTTATLGVLARPTLMQLL